MNEIKETGGARIGRVNLTWPFVTLTVTKDKLELDTTFLGSFKFIPTDISSIEKCSGFLSDGIKINHKVQKYKSNLIFWTFSDTNVLLKKIEQTGFLSNDNSISK